MRRSKSWAWISVSMLMVAGCGVAGHWASRSFDPEIGRDRFRLVGDACDHNEFTKATVDVRRDNTFSAEIYYGQCVQQITGTWEKVGDKLTLVDSKGCSQTYHYNLSGDCKHLKIVRQIDGTDVVLQLERQ